jgi:hypothetical protein
MNHGSDGTRTRDLRRDRTATATNRKNQWPENGFVSANKPEFEAMIRLDIVGVERTAETLFILLLLKFGLVHVLRRRR